MNLLLRFWRRFRLAWGIAMLLRDVQEDLHRSEDARQGRVPYAVRGVVTQVEGFSSGQIGRAKARYAFQDNNEESDWLLPLWPGSIEALPRKGDNVLVIFEDGDPHRGYYAWHPTSNTKDRPSEFAVLGTTLAGMWNALMTSLYTTFKTLFNAHTHTYIYGTTGSPASAWTDAAGHMQDSGGAQVADKSGDQKVLSGNVKIGK